MSLNTAAARAVELLDRAYCWAFCGCRRRDARAWTEARRR